MSFLTKYEALCDKKGVAPSVMPTLVGMSNAIYSKSWKDGAIPRKGNLKKIADFFEVDVSYFKDDNENDQKEKPTPKAESELTLTAEERAFILWLRALPPEKKQAVLNFANSF